MPPKTKGIKTINSLNLNQIHTTLQFLYLPIHAVSAVPDLPRWENIFTW